MKNCDYSREFDGYVFRHIRKEDGESYYRDGFLHPDPESQRLTGSRIFTKEEVLSFFSSCTERDDRADFLLVSPEGRIIGESVLNEYDPAVESCNFRICIFSPEFRDRGLGSAMTRFTLEYAFAHWGLRRVSLEVFSFNPRAQRVYENAGFSREGVLRQAVRDGDGFGDVILMSMLREEWEQK